MERTCPACSRALPQSEGRMGTCPHCGAGLVADNERNSTSYRAALLSDLLGEVKKAEQSQPVAATAIAEKLKCASKD